MKSYLKSGVMENGVVYRTEEGSTQGGPLLPLLANIHLNEFLVGIEKILSLYRLLLTGTCREDRI